MGLNVVNNNKIQYLNTVHISIDFLKSLKEIIGNKLLQQYRYLFLINLHNRQITLWARVSFYRRQIRGESRFPGECNEGLYFYFVKHE